MRDGFVLVAEYRKALGIAQWQLADFLGRTQPWVHYVESGRFLPTDADAARLAEFFGCPRTDIASRGPR